MQEQITGIIFDIKKFAIHDGPGIRTTVFLKGCPLKCLWCHNPESQQIVSELSFMANKCIGCGSCFENCPEHAHKMKDGIHIIDRESCKACMQCTKQCNAKGLESIGKEISVDEIIKEVLKDSVFYENSGGGITISGGEPMSQVKFTLELLKKAKENGLHTCLDTCGFTSFANYAKVLKYVDIFLYDIKETNLKLHKEYTSVELAPILENMKKIDATGGKIILRCPLIPNLNARIEHLKKIAELANSLKNIIEINLEPYHPLGSSKSERIGKKYPLSEKHFVDDKTKNQWLKTMKNLTSIPVK